MKIVVNIVFLQSHNRLIVSRPIEQVVGWNSLPFLLNKIQPVMSWCNFEWSSCQPGFESFAAQFRWHFIHLNYDIATMSLKFLSHRLILSFTCLDACLCLLLRFQYSGCFWVSLPTHLPLIFCFSSLPVLFLLSYFVSFAFSLLCCSLSSWQMCLLRG